MAIIIIVDDDKTSCYLIDKAVRAKEDCITFHACSSKCFFKLIKKAVPDFIFLKAVMPGPDAMYCLKKIRSNKKYNGVPVIAYFNSEDYKREAYKYKANLYITKPESDQEASAAIQSILSFDWKQNLYPTLESFRVGLA